LTISIFNNWGRSWLHFKETEEGVALMYRNSSFAKITLALLLLVPELAYAQDSSITVTVYNQNRALITEVRKLNVPKGLQTLEFKDVAETIEPASLQVRSLTSPDEFKVLDQNYEYDLINVQNLLNKYVGKELKVVIPDPAGPKGAKIVREAKLLANNDKPVFQLIPEGEGSSAEPGNDVYVGDYDAVLLPKIPEGLRPQPTLVWLVDNRGPADQQIQVSYLADKMNWKADYVLKVDRESTKGSLSGWVTLENQSGKTFKSANLKLVAGDIHLVEQGRIGGAPRGIAALAKSADTMQQEDLFEYHLYSMGRPVDVADRQTKQVSLLQAPDVKLEKRLVGRWISQIYGAPQQEAQKEKLAAMLKFNNSQKDGLGMPLPKGIVRIYQDSGDGTNVFIGEDKIDHTAKSADVELTAGQAFDVFVERKLTDYRKIGNNAVRYGWELKIKNGKETPQRVELEETIPAEWMILNSNMKYEKLDAHRIKFVVDAPPSAKGSEATVTYEAEIHW
jgi:hypothetical protein